MRLLNAGWGGKVEGGRLEGVEEVETDGRYQQGEVTWVDLAGSWDGMKIWVLILI